MANTTKCISVVIKGVGDVPAWDAAPTAEFENGTVVVEPGDAYWFDELRNEEPPATEFTVSYYDVSEETAELLHEDTYTEGDTVTVWTAPDKELLYFDGWYTVDTLTGDKVDPETELTDVTEDTSYYCQYSETEPK